MKELNQLTRTDRLLISFFVFLGLLLSGCTNKELIKQKIPAKQEKPKISHSNSEQEWKLPIAIPEGQGEFYKVVGWISDSQLLYITNMEQTSRLFQYNLITGKSTFIYKTEAPIVNVQISPSKKYYLIHSAPSSYEGEVTIIDQRGAEQLQKSIPSYDLNFEWNAENEAEVLVTKFDQNWGFASFLLDLDKAELTELSLRQPFVKWMNAKEIAFLDWDEDHPALYAPLITKELTAGTEKTFVPQATHFTAFPDLLMAVSVKEEDQSKAIYTFYNEQLKPIAHFSIPQLSKFSDWLVPFYDYNKKTGQFLTLSPIKSGEVDSYTDGFTLTDFDLDKGSSKPLIEGLENAPITIAPSGDALLYGNRFEQILDLTTKKIYNLIEE